LKILDKYIFIEFLLPFIAGNGIITGVWLGIDKLKIVFKLLANSGASLLNAFIILSLEIPHMIALTIPVTILFASFLSIQKLDKNSEIIALRASGISLKRILLSILYLGTAGALFSFIINELLVPYTSPLAKQVYTIALYKDPISKSSSGENFYFIEKDSGAKIKRIFFSESIEDKKLKSAIAINLEKSDSLEILESKEAFWDYERGGWILNQGEAHILTNTDQEGDSSYIASDFDKLFIPSSLDPSKILKRISQIKEMSFWDLKTYLEQNRTLLDRESKLNSVISHLNNKLAYPLSCIFLAVIGACLGLTRRREVINWAYIGIGLVVFLFYVSVTFCESLGESGVINPELAMWIPVFLFGALAYGVYLYKANQ
jgi:lipopolysaccharide export system permease protein